MIHHKYGTPMTWKEKIMKGTNQANGYLCVRLSGKTKNIHQLVAMTFLGHVPNGVGGNVIDHINSVKTDNRVVNLRIVSHRFNSTKDKLLTSSSKHPGVSWNNLTSKWQAAIQINGKLKYLGRFTDELEAAEAYQKQLRLLGNF